MDSPLCLRLSVRLVLIVSSLSHETQKMNYCKNVIYVMYSYQQAELFFVSQ